MAPGGRGEERCPDGPGERGPGAGRWLRACSSAVALANTVKCHVGSAAAAARPAGVGLRGRVEGSIGDTDGCHRFREGSRAGAK